MKLTVDVDLEDCYDMSDILYEVRTSLVSKVLKNITFEVPDPRYLFAEGMMKDPKIVELIEVRKGQLRELLSQEIEDYSAEVI